MKRIGILLPGSNVYPRLSSEFVSGIKAVIGNEYELKMYDVKTGGKSDEILSVVKMACIQDDLLAVIGFISSRVAGPVTAYFDSMQIPFVMSNLGANLICDKVDSKFISHIDYNMADMAFALGVYAGGQGHKRLLLAMSLYDCGYNIHFAFQTGYQSVSDGAVEYYVSKELFREKDQQLFLQTVRNSSPDAMFSLFCGSEAKEFYTFITKGEYYKDIAHYSTHLAEKHWEIPADGSLLYANCIQNKNPEFNEFEILGFESASILKAKLNNEENYSWGSRQGLLFHPEINKFIPDIFLFGYQQGKNIECKTLDLTQAYFEQVKSMDNLSSTGWDNPYLCV